MNRIIIQASVLVLLVVGISIGANAQSDQYRAEIPFSFEVAGKHYEAGKYAVGPMSQVSSPGAIAIRDLKNGNSRVLGVGSIQGDNNWDKPGTLTFLNVNGQYRLSRISTPSFEMSIKGKGVKSRDLAASSDSKTVMIALNR